MDIAVDLLRLSVPKDIWFCSLVRFSRGILLAKKVPERACGFESRSRGVKNRGMAKLADAPFKKRPSATIGAGERMAL